MNRLKLLIVDDQLIVHQVFKKACREFEDCFELFYANDGWSAIEIYNKEPINILITDINMPEINGFELIRELSSFKHPSDSYKTHYHIITGESKTVDSRFKKQFNVESIIYKPLDCNRILKSFKKKYFK